MTAKKRRRRTPEVLAALGVSTDSKPVFVGLVPAPGSRPTPGLNNRIRHSNFIERTFGETRRRAKVIGRFPGETSCISIVWAVFDRASRGWRGLIMTPAGLRQLHDLRRSLLHPPRQRRPQHTPEHATQSIETVSATAEHHRPKQEPAPADSHRNLDATHERTLLTTATMPEAA